MSSLNWEVTYRYSYRRPEDDDDNPSLYELWGCPMSERKWYYDALARIEKQGKKWELTTYNTQGFQQTRGTYKTLKEAKAMGIAFIAMEGIKHE